MHNYRLKGSGFNVQGWKIPNITHINYIVSKILPQSARRSQRLLILFFYLYQELLAFFANSTVNNSVSYSINLVASVPIGCRWADTRNLRPSFSATFHLIKSAKSLIALYQKLVSWARLIYHELLSLLCVQRISTPFWANPPAEIWFARYSACSFKFATSLGLEPEW